MDHANYTQYPKMSEKIYYKNLETSFSTLTKEEKKRMPLFRTKIDDLTCQDRLGTKRCRTGKETSHGEDGVSTQEEEPIADEEPEFERLLEAALACGHESESGIKCIRRRANPSGHALVGGCRRVCAV